MKGKPVTLRNVPVEIHAWLKESARENGRSMNAQGIWVLRQAKRRDDDGRPEWHDEIAMNRIAAKETI